MASPIRRTPTPDSVVPEPARKRRKPGRRHAVVGACVGLCACATGGLTVLMHPASAATSAPLPTGAGVVLNSPIVDAASTPDGHGYWEDAADGGIFSFGDAQFYGSTGSLTLNRPIVGMAATTDGRGYWEVASDGGVFAFGDAQFHGSTGSLSLASPVVGMVATPDGGGYWEVAADGGVFAFGDAQFLGSAAGMSPASAIVGLAATPDGRGYWEAASDGSVYAFGDASFSGSAPAGQAIVAISADTQGYRLVTNSGGVFALGGAGFYGSTGGQHLSQPVIGSSSSTGGYVNVAADGGIFAFGQAGYYGSLGGSTVRPPAPAPALAVVSDTGITDLQRQLWYHVNSCEEGGVWNVDGPQFSGGLGFTHANWNRFNTFGFPSDAADATPDQQIRVAVAFAEAYWGSPDAAPDTNGCSGY